MSLAFLKPNRLKLIFLAEWAFLILFELAAGDLSPGRALAGSLLPLGSFYLIASTLFALSRKRQQLVRGFGLHFLALSLALVDQITKAVISTNLLYQDSLPLIPGLLHLAHERNLRGSWLLETLDIGFISQAALLCLILPFLFGALIGHGYYTTRHRKSVWADAAYVGLFSGLLSAFCDLALRGFTLDYIHIPGIVTADLKDLLITVALAAYFVEVVDNPGISHLRWRGWRQESREWRELAADVRSYSWQAITRLWATIVSWWGNVKR